MLKESVMINDVMRAARGESSTEVAKPFYKSRENATESTARDDSSIGFVGGILSLKWSL